MRGRAIGGVVAETRARRRLAGRIAKSASVSRAMELQRLGRRFRSRHQPRSAVRAGGGAAYGDVELGNSYPVAVMPAHRRRRPGSRSRSRVAHVARELCGRRLLKGQATTTGFAKGIFARPVTNVSARSRGQRDEYLTPRVLIVVCFGAPSSAQRERKADAARRAAGQAVQPHRESCE